MKPDRKTIKSSSILTTAKSLKQLPKRVTKISSKTCLTVAKIQQSNSKPRKTTEGSLFNHSNKENSEIEINRKQSLKLKESKQSIGIMAFDNINESSE
jgi:hypothetical protein